MKGYCDRCGRAVYDSDLTHAHLDPHIDRWICDECANRLYHWFKMECHRYDCDEVVHI